MCHVEGPSHVPAFAATDGQRIWVVFIRKVGDAGEITLNVADPAGNWSIRSVAVLSGRDPEDTRPTLVTAAGDGREPGRVTLAPYSATRVELSR